MTAARLDPGPVDAAPPADGAASEQLDAAELTGLLRTPGWLRELGGTAWLLVGVTVLLVGAVWLLSLTQTIVMPVVAAAVIAAVASPLLSWLVAHHVPRAAGAVLLLVGLVVLVIGIVVAIVGGIASQTGDLAGHLAQAKDTISGWMIDAGVDPDRATGATSDAGSALSQAVPALLDGVTAGIKKLSSLVIFLSLTCLSILFLLKDGPQIRSWAERHLGVPERVAHMVTGRTLQSLRGYFVGVTFVALFNGVLVGIGAVVLGVPLAGTIALITFFAAYIPFLGAWGAGAFSVLVALGGAGTDAAIGMAVLQLLANGLFQQMVQPIAYGAALGIHPLAVLVVTIAGGSLFGAAGLILAAPLTSAVVRVAGDVGRARAQAQADVTPSG